MDRVCVVYMYNVINDSDTCGNGGVTVLCMVL